MTLANLNNITKKLEKELEFMQLGDDEPYVFIGDDGYTKKEVSEAIRVKDSKVLNWLTG